MMLVLLVDFRDILVYKMEYGLLLSFTMAYGSFKTP